jgi:hypothetical protein
LKITQSLENFLDNHLPLQQPEYHMPYLYAKPMIFHSIVVFAEEALDMKTMVFFED